LKYPFRIDQGSPGTEIKQNLVTDKIEINPKIDDAVFNKPAQPPAPPAETTPSQAPTSAQPPK
jgi:hypothetical protein